MTPPIPYWPVSTISGAAKPAKTMPNVVSTRTALSDGQPRSGQATRTHTTVRHRVPAREAPQIAA